MAYHFDHLPHLKSLNLQFRQEIKIFYSKRLVTTWTIALSWYLNYLTGYSTIYVLVSSYYYSAGFAEPPPPSRRFSGDAGDGNDAARSAITDCCLPLPLTLWNTIRHASPWSYGSELEPKREAQKNPTRFLLHHIHRVSIESASHELPTMRRRRLAAMAHRQYSSAATFSRSQFCRLMTSIHTH